MGESVTIKPGDDLRLAAARSWGEPVRVVATTGEIVIVAARAGGHKRHNLVLGLHDEHGRYWTQEQVANLCIKASLFTLPPAFYVEHAGEHCGIRLVDEVLPGQRVFTCLQAQSSRGDDVLPELPVIEAPRTDTVPRPWRRWWRDRRGSSRAQA